MRTALTRAANWLGNKYTDYKFIADEENRTIIMLLDGIQIGEEIYFQEYTELRVITKRFRDIIKARIKNHVENKQAKLF